MLVKRVALPSRGEFCFGCNQPFGGGAPAVRFESDLVPPSDRAELAGLSFHPGHLIRYASRRNWTSLVTYLEQSGPSNY